MAITLLRMESVLARRGIRRAKLYKDIGARLFPKPVKAGRLSAWPEHEVDALNAATIRGASDAERRRLVKKLETARKDT